MLKCTWWLSCFCGWCDVDETQMSSHFDSVTVDNFNWLWIDAPMWLFGAWKLKWNWWQLIVGFFNSKCNYFSLKIGTQNMSYFVFSFGCLASMSREKHKKNLVLSNNCKIPSRLEWKYLLHKKIAWNVLYHIMQSWGMHFNANKCV